MVSLNETEVLVILLCFVMIKVTHDTTQLLVRASGETPKLSTML